MFWNLPAFKNWECGLWRQKCTYCTYTVYSTIIVYLPIADVFYGQSGGGSNQGWEFALRSFAHFAQNKWATVSNSLRTLKTNERPWANRSGHSEEMSDRERFSQVAQRKWAMWANRSFRSEEMSKCAIRSKNVGLKKSKNLFYYVLFKVFFF